MAIIEEIIDETKIQNKDEIEVVKKETLEEEEEKGDPDEDGDVFFDTTEYTTEEFNKLVKESTDYKLKGNDYFAKGEYTAAITEYENALLVCPASLFKDRAIYFGNIAACHLKQGEFKEARDMCTQSLKLDPKYLKALLRRAQANEKLNTSTSLTQSLEDYKQLKQLAKDSYTLRECQRAERELPTKIKQKTEQEKEEMMSKLKDLGNSILGKFGLSTDNFQLQPDPSGSGGYTMNFVNNNNK